MNYEISPLMNIIQCVSFFNTPCFKQFHFFKYPYKSFLRLAKLIIIYKNSRLLILQMVKSFIVKI